MPEQYAVMNAEAYILKAIESGDGITETEISQSTGFPKELIKAKLLQLKKSGAQVESRKIGNADLWYPLFERSVKKVLIVEDDKSINDLEKYTLGDGYEVFQAYDKTSGIVMAREKKPDLILLDLMLDKSDKTEGLDICQTLKKDPETKGTIIIIVSAADIAKNRFKGIKYGADYYIPKPFDAKNLRSLAKIFLRKKGKRFDPLVDLPDEGRISRELDALVGSGADYEVCNLRIMNLEKHAQDFGEEDAKVIIRLVSQMLQDKARDWETTDGFVGYIGKGEFVIAGRKDETGAIASKVAGDFDNVLPYIYQDKKIIDMDVDSMFGPAMPDRRMSIKFDMVPTKRIAERREQLITREGAERGKPAGKGAPKEAGGYTYEQLRDLIGSENLDVAITRDSTGTKVSVSKAKKDA